MSTVFFTTSWDDGDKRDLRMQKLMDKYGIKGTFYVPGNCDITSKEIKQLAKTQEVGAHTMNHKSLDRISLKEAKKEIEESKVFLEKILRKKVTSFCYPKGHHNEQVAKLVKKAGFKYGRTTHRFHFDLAKNPFLNGTSAQTITFKADFFKFLPVANFNLFCVRYVYDWDYFMKRLFKHVSKRGGILHLWGHSWEVDQFKQWEMLERFFSFISKQKNVKFVTNTQLLNK